MMMMRMSEKEMKVQRTKNENGKWKMERRRMKTEETPKRRSAAEAGAEAKEGEWRKEKL